jgi:hypothetical protein
MPYNYILTDKDLEKVWNGYPVAYGPIEGSTLEKPIYQYYFISDIDHETCMCEVNVILENKLYEAYIILKSTIYESVIKDARFVTDEERVIIDFIRIK